MDNCILWTGATDKDGYGTRSIKGVKYQAHRVAYAEHTNEDIDGKVIMHTCDNPPCVNPKHLKAGIQLDNVRDIIAKGRRRKRVALGEANSVAKLTAKDVRATRVRIAEGKPLKELAKLYGVSPTTITAIKTGQNWGWLD